MKQKYRYEAPEGGWGILICIGSAIPFATSIGSLPSFGLLFGDFFKSIGAETSAVSIMTSTYFFSLSSSGLFSGPLFNRYGVRRVAVFAGILYTLGSFMQIFVSSSLDLLIAFGLLQGIGFGFIMPAFYAIFHEYFVKKRVLWMCLAQTIFGVLVMAFPVVMQALREQYGFRGALAILCAINANSIAGMLIMHPVKWHMRKVPITDHELLEKTDHISTVIKENDPKNAKIASDDSHQNSPLMSTTTKLGQTDLASHSDNPRIVKKSVWKLVVDFLDLSLLKDPKFVNIVVGVTCTLYSDIVFFTLQSMYLFELGYTNSDTSKVIAIGSAADLVSRFSLSFIAMCIKTSSRNIFLAGAIGSIISRFVFLEVRDFLGVAIITAVMGFLRTWIHIALPLIFGEYLPTERFATAYGLYLCIQGYSAFAMGPVIGYLRDSTKSYVITFHVLNAIMGLCVICWLVEYAYLKFIKKQKINMPMDGNIRTDIVIAH